MGSRDRPSREKKKKPKDKSVAPRTCPWASSSIRGLGPISRAHARLLPASVRHCAAERLAAAHRTLARSLSASLPRSPRPEPQRGHLLRQPPRGDRRPIRAMKSSVKVRSCAVARRYARSSFAGRDGRCRPGRTAGTERHGQPASIGAGPSRYSASLRFRRSPGRTARSARRDGRTESNRSIPWSTASSRSCGEPRPIRYAGGIVGEQPDDHVDRLAPLDPRLVPASPRCSGRRTGGEAMKRVESPRRSGSRPPWMTPSGPGRPGHARRCSAPPSVGASVASWNQLALDDG